MTSTRALQLATLEIDGARYAVDLRSPHDLAIALDFDELQPRWFGAPPAHSSPLASGTFTGRVHSGASCNCSTMTLTPHLDGTHTECAGHLTLEKMEARKVVPVGFVKAVLVSVTPTPADRTEESSHPAPRADDLLITAAALTRAWPAEPPFVPQGLVVRTLPNSALKRTRDYRSEPAPFLSLPAAALLVARGIEHLVLDIPSADRAEDGGQLSAHREFFGLPAGSVARGAVRRPQCTITELAYIDDAVIDGAYLLSLQIPALGGDAVPSRPLLFPVRAA
ncbi:MAG TPA: cyclase family protein [Steroidobacteraceae bacterium]|jgi:kynurenine formamidase|nr:cyclase family protein [Steroidobacteraceae bacterium]